jgi:aspartyl-tRNA(Asn)/glutamyl-tRNA(Gln) amidotransferase subunit C
MSTLKIDDVKHVAKLAKLELTEKEIRDFHRELSKVVGYFDQLKEVDTKNIDPTSQTTGLTNVLREDEINPIDILSQDNLFLVPKILKNK